LPERDRPREQWLRDYMERSSADLKWARRHALADNDEAEIGKVMDRLEAARKAVPPLFPLTPVVPSSQ